MIGDLAGFRQLLGVAPDGKLAVLDALLAGEDSVEGLVLASRLPRRDVEEFTAALGLSAAGARDGYRKLLAGYRASRAVVRAGDEADLARAAADLIAGVPAPLKRLDHVQATPDTLVRRVAWLTDTFDLSGRPVLFAGDHDVTSVLLHRVVPDADLTVADIDERLLAYIDEVTGSRVRCVYADFRFGLPPVLDGAADVVVTDPPYTPEGLGLFLSRSLQGLRRDEPAARIVIAYGHSRRRADLGVAAQREILRYDVAIDAMLPAFNSYHGAQAVGSASDWYSCQPTPRAFRRLDQAASQGSPRGIYTRGERSVESSPRGTARLTQVLPELGLSGVTAGLISPEQAPAGDFAVTAGLGKLLHDGLHPSVTGRAQDVIVDLRDDPGPWLLRAMLALNARRAVFVVPRRHEALDRLTSGAGEWDLLRPKFTSVSAAGVGDLVAVRCELADEEAGDPGSALTRYVTRRAHGRLRNVWREGLIAAAAASGTTLPKRAATDLAVEHAGDRSADLALRLIDVPSAHFPGLRSALRTSAEDVSSLPEVVAFRAAG